MTVLVLAGLSGCDEENTNRPTATASTPTLEALVPVSGNGQCGEPNSPLGEEFTVLAVDDQDHPLSGITVDWHVTRGGGDLSVASSTTDDEGKAGVKYALGPWVGTNVVRASGPSVTVTPIAFFSSARGDDGSEELVFEQAVPDVRPDDRGLFDHSRYLLYTDGTFEYETESEAGETSVREGSYSRSDSLITFNFGWGEAAGVVDESHLTVELSDVAQLSDYPGGGVYVLCSTR